MTDKVMLEKLLSGTELPTLPEIARDVTRRVKDPDVSVQEIAELVRRDPVLATRVLKLVNSPYYGLPRAVTDIRQAISLIGLNKLRILILTTQVLNTFQYKGDPDVFTFQMFWEHELTVALAAETIAEHTEGVSSSDAFIGGLLHDLGKLLIAIYFPARFNQVINALNEESDRFPHELEPDIMGADHGQICGWFMRKWGLSDELASAVEHHHRPARKGIVDPAAGVIHAADILARATGIGCANWDKVPPPDPFVWKYFDLTGDRLRRIVTRLNEKVALAEDFFAVVREAEQEIQTGVSRGPA